MIDVRNVVKLFGDKPVLTDVNMTVSDGSIYGLVGINGSGKSTLLRIISGIYIPNNGEVYIDGINVNQAPDLAKQNLFFLNEDPFYSINDSASDLVSFYSSFYDTFSKDEFYRIVNVLNLNINTKITSFSKGMKRQLFVALAFASGCKNILFDEAFDGLDPLARLNLKRILIEKVSTDHISVVISSHSLRELEDIADNFGILDKGLLTDKGSLEGKNDVCKFSLAFDHDISKDDFSNIDVASFKQNGKIVEIVARGTKEKVIVELKKLSPLMIEEGNITFEDLFILEVDHKEGKR